MTLQATPQAEPAAPEDRFVTVGGVRVRYRQAGGGPFQVVLLHGIGRSLEDWDENIAALSAHHRVTALDLIGFGQSDKPDVPYSLPGLARFLKHFLDALGIGEAALVGSSLGGAVALQFAAMYPARVRRLVLVGSAGFGAEVALGLRLCSLPGVGEVLLRPSRAGTERTLRALFHDPKFVTWERVERAYGLGQLPGAGRAFLSVTRALGTWRGVRREWREAIAERLRGSQIPALIVWGRHDKIVPAAHLDAARALLPQARMRVFEHCGHFPQIECAAGFNELLLDFLAPARRAGADAVP